MTATSDLIRKTPAHPALTASFADAAVAVETHLPDGFDKNYVLASLELLFARARQAYVDAVGFVNFVVQGSSVQVPLGKGATLFHLAVKALDASGYAPDVAVLMLETWDLRDATGMKVSFAALDVHANETFYLNPPAGIGG